MHSGQGSIGDEVVRWASEDRRDFRTWIQVDRSQPLQRVALSTNIGLPVREEYTVQAVGKKSSRVWCGRTCL